MIEPTRFSPEQLQAAVRFVEANPSAGPPPPADLQKALRPLISDRRWMSDELPEIAAWLFDKFQDPSPSITPELRAVLAVLALVVERMAEQTPGVGVRHRKMLIRDPVTRQVLGVEEAGVATL